MTLHPKYRTDIDGLRAIAVLAVVAFHAFPKVITGGFIGVDIFFVISGFLISTILYENLERNQFSFTEFYARRIRRIFPALIVVLATCFTLGWFVLLPDEYRQLGSHMAGGAGFVQNYVLWNEAGYFDNTADTKPLLHLWSLGIEEQFYIVWPVLLWLAYRLRTNLLALTILIGLISFGLNIYGVKDNGTATFYSPQTRFWELLVGAILAYLTLHRQSILAKWPILSASTVSPKIWANVRSTLGLIFLILGLVLINKGSLFPGWWALLPAIGTVLILSAGPTAWFNRIILSNKVLTWLGLISYPLYLWHWALLSFARIMESETPNVWIRLAIVLISIGLSALTYYLIDKPIRFGKHQKIKTIILVVLMSIVGFVGYNTYVRDGLGFRGGISQFDMTDNFNLYTTYADDSC
jgi:peptidoglycan/LPS O-acetylase OafA/YrhL